MMAMVHRAQTFPKARGGDHNESAAGRGHHDPERPPMPPETDGETVRSEAESPPGGQRELRMTWRSRSRTFLRKVFRLTPRSSAALIWLPRVAASAAPISGASISRRTR